MRKLLVIIFITITLPLTAQEVRTARVIKKAAVAEEPVPTPAPRRSIIDRFFTREKPTPTPPPKVAATPAPRTKSKVGAKSGRPVVKAPPKPKAKEPSEEPAAEKTSDTPAATDTPATTATPPVPTEVPKATEPPKEEVKGPKGKAGSKPEKPDFSGLDEAGKYKAAKDFALKDQAIIDLKNKAESTIDDDAAKQATLNYNRALFKKIRAIEPSLDAYVDKLEEAVLKRVK